MASRVLNNEKRHFQAVFEDTFPGALGTPWDWEISARSFFSRSATPAASVAGDKGGIGSVADRHGSTAPTPAARSRVTCAATFNSFRRTLPAVACANSVPAKPC
jgi:hypothetical protein